MHLFGRFTTFFKGLFFTYALCISIPLTAWTPSEIQDYRLLCKRALEKPQNYAKLRKSSLHRKMIEPFSSRDEASYRLQVDREHLYPHVLNTLLTQLDTKMKSAKKTRSSKKKSISPLFLRHAQIAIELEREFGDLSQLRILQIGSGFGALPAYLAKTTGYGSYTLLDYPECLSLQKTFLNACSVSNITYLSTSELHSLQEYDLVICVFPFTQWADAHLRNVLLQKIVTTPRGYLTCHQPWHPSKTDNTLEDELLLKLARHGHHVHAAPERGNPSLCHSVIQWGTQETTGIALSPLLPSKNPQALSAVTMGEWGARLGDQLLVYAHTKWIAHRYGLHMLPRHFDYAEGFALSTLYPKAGPEFQYAKALRPKKHREITQALSTPSTLFTIDYFAETDFESHHYPLYGTYFYTCWRDRGFIQALRKDFAPATPEALEKALLDDSDVHLAVHLRLGGGFDNTHYLQTEPNLTLKSPQHAFYLEQIARVASYFPHRSIQVHLFTDDPNPQELADMYIALLNNPRLHFTYRVSENRHDMHVLDDFFAMAAYDCLIHPQSNFSTMASLRGDYAVRITPVHAVWKSTQWVVDAVECYIDGTHRLFR